MKGRGLVDPRHKVKMRKGAAEQGHLPHHGKEGGDRAQTSGTSLSTCLHVLDDDPHPGWC